MAYQSPTPTVPINFEDGGASNPSPVNLDFGYEPGSLPPQVEYTQVHPGNLNYNAVKPSTAWAYVNVQLHSAIENWQAVELASIFSADVTMPEAAKLDYAARFLRSEFASLATEALPSSIEWVALVTETEDFIRQIVNLSNPAILNMMAGSSATAHPDISGFPAGTFFQTRDTYYLTDDLERHQTDYWPPYPDIITNVGMYNVTLAHVQPLVSAHWNIDGFLTPHYKQDYYYRIHVTPADINMGSVLSEQTKEVSIWNAWETTKSLSAISSVGSSGITLSPPETFPAVFQPNEFRRYTVSASLNGPPVLSATFTFSFPGEAPQLRLRGTRVTLFPIGPNWDTPVRERLEWLTDVMEARTGAEQRMRLRQHPRLVVEYEPLLLPDVIPLFGSLMFGWHSRQWGLPLWYQAQLTKTPVVSGMDTVTCSTASYEFFVDGYAVLYLSPTLYETFKIGAMTASALTASTPISGDWPAGTQIMPLRFGYMTEATSAEYHTGEVATASITVVSEQHRAVTPTTWPVSYRGLPVLDVEPNWDGTRREHWEGRMDVFEAAIGQSLYVDRTGYARASRAHRLTALNRSKVATYRNLLNYASGKLKEFWAPSCNRDMVVVEDIQATQNWLTCKFFGYTSQVDMHEQRRDIRISTRSGLTYYRRITSADSVNVPQGTERIFLDSPIPVNIPARQTLVSFLMLARLDSDAVETSWITPNISDTVVTVTAAPQ